MERNVLCILNLQEAMQIFFFSICVAYVLCFATDEATLCVDVTLTFHTLT